MKKIISLLLICLLLTGCKDKYQVIDSNQAMELINNNNPIIIDVRTKDEYNERHIKNSINIPLASINSINYNKETIIILYCNYGEQSKVAAKELYNLGYTNIYTLDGGLLNWGFSLE